VSLDSDEQKWKDFVARNGMTWPQNRDGGFSGSRLFSVQAIPHTMPGPMPNAQPLKGASA